MFLDSSSYIAVISDHHGFRQRLADGILCRRFVPAMPAIRYCRQNLLMPMIRFGHPGSWCCSTLICVPFLTSVCGKGMVDVSQSFFLISKGDVSCRFFIAVKSRCAEYAMEIVYTMRHLLLARIVRCSMNIRSEKHLIFKSLE